MFLNLGPFLNIKGVPMLTLHLLLREPLINSARFDVCSEMTLSLTALARSGTVTLQQLDAVGLALKDAQALGSLLGTQGLIRETGRTWTWIWLTVEVSSTKLKTRTMAMFLTDLKT